MSANLEMLPGPTAQELARSTALFLMVVKSKRLDQFRNWSADTDRILDGILAANLNASGDVSVPEPNGSTTVRPTRDALTELGAATLLLLGQRGAPLIDWYTSNPLGPDSPDIHYFVKAAERCGLVKAAKEVAS